MHFSILSVNISVKTTNTLKILRQLLRKSKGTAAGLLTVHLSSPRKCGLETQCFIDGYIPAYARMRILENKIT